MRRRYGIEATAETGGQQREIGRCTGERSATVPAAPRFKGRATHLVLNLAGRLLRCMEPKEARDEGESDDLRGRGWGGQTRVGDGGRREEGETDRVRDSSAWHVECDDDDLDRTTE